MARTQIQSPDIAPGAINPTKLQPSGVTGGTYSYIQALTVGSTGLITGIVPGRLSYSPNQISPGFALGDLLDTSPSSVSSGQILIYRTGKWVNESPNFTGATDVEAVQDIVGAMVSPSTAIRWVYSDASGKLRAFLSPAAVDHGALAGLLDDDHSIYLTSPRANTWLASKTTTNLTEGSNLYFTNERAQDAVGTALINTSTIRFTYNDGSNTIAADVSPANISHGLLSGLSSGDPHTQYQLRSEKNANSGYLGLTSGGLVSPARLGSAPAAGRVLYGNNTWASPAVVITDHGALTGLADDDHTQYLTSPRANTWLATKTTDNLTEGSNLYFTNERAQDAVGSSLTNSSTIRFTYNDGANTISADVSPANIAHSGLSGLTSGDPHTQYQLRSERNANSGYLGLTSGGLVSPGRLATSPAAGKVLYGNNTWASPSVGVTDHGALSGLADDDHTQYHTATRADSWLATKTTSNLTEGSNLYFTDERAQDAVGSILTNSASLSFVYNDVSNTITGNVSPAGITHNSLAGLTAGDPHTQYQLRSERNAANGYVGLNASSLVSPIRLGASPAAGEVLYGNNVWASPRLNGMADLRLGFVAPLGNRHHLLWNTSQQRWLNELYETTLASSSDVEIAAPSNGQVLLYEDGTWYNVSPNLIDHGAFGGLLDDDHTQYHTDARANTWLGTRNIGELADVSPVTPLNGHVLTWQSSSGRWTNQAPASSGGGTTVRRAEVLVNFLSSPANEASLVTTAVTASWVSPAMLLVCSVSGRATSDHDPEDGVLEGILASASNISAGVGFDLITSAPRGTWGSYYINVLGV